MGGAPTKKRATRGALAGAVAALGILVAACGPPAPSAAPAPAAAPAGCPTSPPDAVASTVFNRTNADRAARGLGRLAWDGSLACLAKEWSGVMASKRSLTHRNLGSILGSPGYESFQSLAENIFMGPGSSSGDTIHNAWMNSSHHYANIMGAFDSFGFGTATSSDGQIWATENFGRHF